MERMTLVLLAAAGLAACAGDRVPQAIRVVGTDYVFAVPATAKAGPTTFTLVNEGRAPHHVQLVRLESGKTVADLIEAMAVSEHPPAWARLVGGPGTVDAGDSSVVTVDLRAGQHALLCVIPAPDGQPHMAKGMIASLSVGGGPAPAARADADLVMTLYDYGYDLSGRLAPGPVRVRIENRGPQPHEVVFVRLNPAATAQDYVAWVMDGMQGAAPGRLVGGALGLAPGESNVASLRLAAGEYALLCFLSDVQDRAPHVLHGMVAQVTVG